MNKEEQEAIDYFKKEIVNNDIDYGQWFEDMDLEEQYKFWNYSKILLNYIDKLQADYQVLEDDLKDHRIAYIDTPEFEEHYISKDKIRDKIKELENIEQEDVDYSRIKFATIVLQELLEEN